MSEFESLLAHMKIAGHNLATLHRHLCGESWECYHEKLGEWHDELGNQLDDLAEVGISLGYKEPSIKDAVLQYGGDVLDGQPRDVKATLTAARGILQGVVSYMQAAEPSLPPMVQNKLQEYEYGWHKIEAYAIAQALGKSMMQEDDD